MIDFAPGPDPRVPVRMFSGFTLADGRRGGVCWDQKPRCPAVSAGTGSRPATRSSCATSPPTPWSLACTRTGATRPSAGSDSTVSLNTFGGSAAVRGTGERWWLAVEVTDAHVRAMRERPMIFLERMSLLACVLPGVDLDLLGAGDVDDGG